MCSAHFSSWNYEIHGSQIDVLSNITWFTAKEIYPTRFCTHPKIISSIILKAVGWNRQWIHMCRWSMSPRYTVATEDTKQSLIFLRAYFFKEWNYFLEYDLLLIFLIRVNTEKINGNMIIIWTKIRVFSWFYSVWENL